MVEGWRDLTLEELCEGKGEYGANVSKAAFDPRLPRYVRITDIDDSGGLRREDPVSIGSAEAAPYLLRDGDLLLARSGATVGKSYLYRSAHGLCAYAGYLIRFRPDVSRASPAFLAQFLRSQRYWKWIAETQRAQAQPNVNAAEYGKLAIAVPPLPEQRKIAAILSSVDEAIDASQAVIDQLQVVKKAMMSELLTRGMPGRHTRFKQTEIGEVPEGWGVADLGSLASLVTSGSRGWATYYSETGALFLRITNLVRGQMRLDLSDLQHVTLPEGSTEGTRTKALAGDVLFSITADLGIVGVVPMGGLGEAYVNQHIALVRLDPSLVDPRFVAAVLAGECGAKQFRRLNDAGAKAALTLGSVRKLLVPIPALTEQRELADLIETAEARVEEEEMALSHLCALKSSLSSALLTGELRVTPDP